MRKKISLYEKLVCREKKVLGVVNSVGAPILSSLLCYQFGVLSSCFSRGTVCLIQAAHLVLPVTDSEALKNIKIGGYPALLFSAEVIISTAEMQQALYCVWSHQESAVPPCCCASPKPQGEGFFCAESLWWEIFPFTMIFLDLLLQKCAHLLVSDGFELGDHMVSQQQAWGFPDLRVAQTAIPINKQFPGAKSKSNSELILVSTLSWKEPFIRLNVRSSLNTLIFCTPIIIFPSSFPLPT